MSNSLQILPSVFIKWSYRLFSVKGCSSLKRKFCTSCAYRRATHAAGFTAHSEVRSLFCLVTQSSTQEVVSFLERSIAYMTNLGKPVNLT